jgi:structure-specific recognition protein 1
MQAFFIFSNEQRAILLESQPELRSNITAVGKMMGDRWKKMSADEKFPYAIKAEEAKLVYEEKAAAAEEVSLF